MRLSAAADTPHTEDGENNQKCQAAGYEQARGRLRHHDTDIAAHTFRLPECDRGIGFALTGDCNRRRSRVPVASRN